MVKLFLFLFSLNFFLQLLAEETYGFYHQLAEQHKLSTGMIY
jgi:hypothetical protein